MEEAEIFPSVVLQDKVLEIYTIQFNDTFVQFSLSNE